MSDQADEAAGNTAVKTGEGEDQTGENPAQAEVPGGPGETKEPSETEKADAAEDTDKTGGSEQTGEQPAGHEDSQTGAELADDGPGDRYFSGGGCLCDPSGDDHVGDAAGERAEL